MSNREDQIIEDLILVGALEVIGLDLDSGEPVYNFTDRLKEFSPDLHDEMNNYFHSEMMFLWENGFVEMDMMQDDPVVKLTAKAFDQSELSKLDKDKQYTIKELKRVIRKES
jgi:hypothetical protein